MTSPNQDPTAKRVYRDRPAKGMTQRAVEGKVGSEYARAVVSTVLKRAAGRQTFMRDGLTVKMDGEPTVDPDNDTMIRIRVVSVQDDQGSDLPNPGLVLISAPRFEVWDGTYWVEEIHRTFEDPDIAPITVEVEHPSLIEDPRGALEEQIIEILKAYIEMSG